ncbi:MAG: stimulus-sensing domain-containing protein [Rhodospirillales bacterium]|nr:stimulus-sensing domain-containing protein [Rhodospirillales bacterium]
MAVRFGFRRSFSPLTRRILFLNSLPLLLLAAGVLYLDDFRRGLIESELQALTTQSQIIAAALGEAAVSVADPDEEERDDRLAPDAARQILRRLIEPTRVRARLFDFTGALIADTRVLGQGSLAVEVEILPPPEPDAPAPHRAIDALSELFGGGLTGNLNLPAYRERRDPVALDYEEAIAALVGDGGRAVRRGPGGRLVLSVAVPVQRFKQVLGALMLSSDSRNIELALRNVRRDILRVAGATLLLTVLLSLYLAGTIARPIRRLARAADRIRTGGGSRARVGGTLGAGAALVGAIPDLSARGDEIGDLSAALREMTEALSRRLDAIDRFAADVAHELKNPLTSLKSAVETAARVPDLSVREKLMAIVLDDVARLDRLITDIAGASRLDSELSRANAEKVDISEVLDRLVDALAAVAKPGQARPVLVRDGGGPFIVMGVEDRLGQVFRNVIANAQSFSPSGADVRVTVSRASEFVTVTIDDDGPGIPADKLESIFERFYSERPADEKFGTHSGLGLSISRQIIDAHGGTIEAENRSNNNGMITGARFRIRLPAA